MAKGEQIRRLAGKRMACPCCQQVRNTHHLLALEQRVRAVDPWKRPPGWSIEAAAAGQLQWACIQCLQQERACAAKPWVQTFCDFMPYFAYFDRAMICKDCGERFVFSAREQQHWYETLHFWVQSQPTRCATCRRRRRQEKQAQAELQTELDRQDSNDAEHLLRIAELYRQIGSSAKAREYLGRARNRAASDKQQREIEQQIEALRDRGLPHS